MEPGAGMTRPFWVALWMLLLATGTLAQQQTATRPGLPISSAEQTVADDEGVVRGRVTDAGSGRPLARAAVILTPTFSQESSQTTLTDASGRYSVRGLTPGEYRVYAQAEGFVSQNNQSFSGTTVAVDVIGGQIVSGLDMELPRAAAVSGQIFDVSGDGFAGVEVELLAELHSPNGPRTAAFVFAKTDASGLFRFGDLPPGQYYVRAYTATPRLDTASDRPTAYAPTFFPSVTRPEHALPLVVQAGQRLEGINYALSVVETFTVSGMVLDVTGSQVDNVRVFMRAVGGPASRGNFLTTTVSRDGAFSFAGIVPGEYALRAGGGAGLVTRRVTVGGDISDLSLVIQPGVRVTGHIVSDGSGPLPLLANRVPTVVAVAYIGTGELVFGHPREMNPDGSFTLNSVVSPAVLSVRGLPDGWIVKGVWLAGRDVSDQPTDFTTALSLPVEIVVTDRVSEVTGHVTDDRGERVDIYTVVVFPQDRSRWGPPFARIRAAQAQHGDHYRIDRLVGGDYFAVAVPSLPPGALGDPFVLGLLFPQAEAFRLDDGEQRTVNLELARTPPGLFP